MNAMTCLDAVFTRNIIEAFMCIKGGSTFNQIY